jgi:hypothetical protein
MRTLDSTLGRFRGSFLRSADQADSRLSFVVPLLELILGDNTYTIMGKFIVSLETGSFGFR